jgi:hypothetical protein
MSALAKKFKRPPSQKTKGGAQWPSPVIPTITGSLKEKNHGPGLFRQKVRHCHKNNQRKKVWRHGSRSRMSASHV